MSKIRISAVNGPAVDASWTDGEGKTVQAWSIPVSGTIDGNESEFQVKVFSQRNIPLVKAGFAPTVDVKGREYPQGSGAWTFNLSKECFPQAPGQSKFGGGGKSFVPREPEREEAAKFPCFALSYAKDVVVALIAKGLKIKEGATGVEMMGNISELQQVLAAHNLNFLRSNAAKAPAQPEQAKPPQAAPGKAAAPAPQPQDMTTKLWAKLQSAGIKEGAQQAGVTVSMLKEWWAESQQSDIMFIKRTKKEIAAAGTQEEPPPPVEEGTGDTDDQLPF